MEKHEQITIAEYQLTAESYRVGTWDHDVSQNREALITAMPRVPGKILDLGCGPGRDLVAFQAMGHEVTGLDATPSFVEMAKQSAGCTVWEQSFLSLDLPSNYFDGMRGNYEGFSERPTGYRYVSGWEYETLAPKLVEAQFQILTHYYRPTGVAIENQSWLVLVAKKAIVQ